MSCFLKLLHSSELILLPFFDFDVLLKLPNLVIQLVSFAVYYREYRRIYVGFLRISLIFLVKTTVRLIWLFLSYLTLLLINPLLSYNLPIRVLLILMFILRLNCLIDTCSVFYSLNIFINISNSKLFSYCQFQ